MNRSVILGYARTPFCKWGGALAQAPAVELGAAAIQASLNRAQIAPEAVEEVVMGMVLQAGAGQVPARQAARKAGLPWSTPAQTVNKVCASGMTAIATADLKLRAGDAGLVVAGGMESMSQAPYFLAGARYGLRMGDAALHDVAIHDGLTCPFEKVHMILHGSQVAAEYGISREAQDAFAWKSHLRAVAAQAAGKLSAEIVPVEVKAARQPPVTVTEDDSIRPDTNMAKLSKLAPVYNPQGTITAGNAPGISDGAAALVLASESEAQAQGWKPLATLLGHAQVAQSAPYIATAPALAIQKLLQKTGCSLDQIHLFEVNEAFAAVVLTTQKLAGLDSSRVNVNGGAIALGHPIGASGARIIGSLIFELQRRGGGLGIAAICSGTAQGDAVLIQV